MRYHSKKKYVRVLTIAGSDCGGGAGIQADLKTFCVFGCYGMSVITALTAQNTLGVQGIYPIPGDFVKQQIDSIISDIGVDAIKIGVLHDKEIVSAVAESIANLPCRIVLDPVLLSTSGHRLVTEEAIFEMINQLFPKATLITPNIAEAAYLTKLSINSLSDMKEAAIRLGTMHAKNVLIKGGHLSGKKSIDLLYQPAEKKFHYFQSKKIETKNTHGTGCTLSAAIAAELAKNTSLTNAIKKAKKYITKAIRSGKKYKLGQGNGPVNHIV